MNEDGGGKCQSRVAATSALGAIRWLSLKLLFFLLQDIIQIGVVFGTFGNPSRMESVQRWFHKIWMCQVWNMQLQIFSIIQIYIE